MPRPASILRDSIAVQDAVARSGSIKQALQLLGLRAAGGNYRALHEACDRLGIDAPRTKHRATLSGTFIAVPDAVIFCQNSTYTNRHEIKRRLIRSGVPEQCALCRIGPEWNGFPLTLHLDHINGVFNDHRRENLRLLCPNCHSQTSTYAGRTGTRVPCFHCTHPNRATAKRCSGCKRWLVRHPGRPEKITWPGDPDLLAMVRTSSMRAVGRALGVSDNAIRRRLRMRGLAG
jgi:hypothetical protein